MEPHHDRYGENHEQDVCEDVGDGAKVEEIGGGYAHRWVGEVTVPRARDGFAAKQVDEGYSSGGEDDIGHGEVANQSALRLLGEAEVEKYH